MNRVEVEDIKQAAAKRWDDVLSSVAGISREFLTGSHVECPKCGGKDRFRFFNDGTGGAICGQCFNKKNGDGLSVIQWYTGLGFPEVKNRVAEYLGLTNGKTKRNGKPKTNGKPATNRKPKKELAVHQMTIERKIGEAAIDRDICRGLLEAKPGITFESITESGAMLVKWSGERAVAFPAHNQRGGDPCGFLLMRVNGEDFAAAGNLQARNKHNLKGGSDGFVIVGGFDRLDASEIVWKVEGIPDALALSTVLPEGHVAVTNICGAKSVKNLPLDWFAGKTVRVIPHSDKPGMDGATDFAQQAAQHAGSVQLVQLPFEVTPDHGKDVRDFLNEGGTFHQLEEIASQAEAVEPNTKADDEPEEAVSDPYRLAEVVWKRHPHLAHYRGEFYLFTNPAYEVLTEDDVRAMIVPIIKAEFNELAEKTPEKITRPLIANVVECLKAMVHQKSTREVPFWIQEPRCRADRCFVAQNAVVDMESIKGGSVRTFDPTPDLFSTNSVDFRFERESNCLKWLGFLDELWGIQSQQVLTLQEILGYCLTDDTSQQKLFMFIGPKRSGKGTIARVAGGLIGRQNVCNPVLGGLQGDFGLEPFLGKRLAIVGDARLSGRADAGIIVERLLSISGEDPQTINRKFRPAITTQLKTRFLLISNELPKLNDASATLPSRIILLNFTRSFYGKEDPKLTDELMGERPGILLWALAGWERLKERGHFVQPDDSREVIAEMEELSSPVLAFIHDRLEVGPGFQTPVSDVFNAWKIWCEEKGRKPGNQQSFGRDLRAAMPSLRISQPRIEGRRVRVYEGVQFNADNW